MMQLLYETIGRLIVAVVGIGVLVFAWEFGKEWLRCRSVRKPKLESLTLFHVDSSQNQYTVPTLDEARDLADWLENEGQLVGFWLEKIEA